MEHCSPVKMQCCLIATRFAVIIIAWLKKMHWGNMWLTMRRERDFLSLLLTKWWSWQTSSPHLPHFFNNALLQKARSVIHYGSRAWTDFFSLSCLSWAQCQCAQVKGKKSFVFHSVNKHSTLNISCGGMLHARGADVRPSRAELGAAFHFGVCG